MSAEDGAAPEIGVPDFSLVHSADVPPESLNAVESGAVVALPSVTAFEITGRGRVECMQGLVSCDLHRAGGPSFLYGAMLTPKGMIVCDLWLALLEERLIVVTAAAGRDAVLAMLERFMPPRLARYTEVSNELPTIRLVGPRATQVAAEAAVPIPQPGRVVESEDAIVARPERDEPFSLQVQCRPDAVERSLAALTVAGAQRGGHGALEVARVLDGWPRLGAEIDSKTLPQEVRYDDLGAVSYSKGCYVGQETVARLHFRGHANRRLQGLVWHERPDPTIRAITYADTEVGRTTSIVSLDASNRYFGLGIVRKEIATGSIVVAAGTSATVTDLPFRRRR